MRRVCVIQARMGSRRLPGKTLRDLAGRPMLGHVVNRLRACTSLDEIVVATSVDPADDPIVDWALSEGLRTSRGSERNVLARVIDAAQAAEADVVVRVTGDCPLLDPQVADRVVNDLTANASAADYASNVLRRTYPRGLDVEALFLDTLQRVNRLALTDLEREHVTVTIRSARPNLFLARSVEANTNDSDLRWTVDEANDLELMHRLFGALGLAESITPYAEVVTYVREHPELLRLNSGIATWTPPEARTGDEEPTG